jgi:hypothetical protein
MADFVLIRVLPPGFCLFALNRSISWQHVLDFAGQSNWLRNANVITRS